MTNSPFKRFGVMLDMSRNAVMKPDSLKEFAKTLADMGYNTLLLYTEETYEIPEEPYFGHFRGRYTAADIKNVTDFCDTLGMEVIPCIQTLAHLEGIFKWKHYLPIRDLNNILLADDEKTYDLIRNMLRTVKKTYKTNLVHIGMDEAHMLGLGKYLDQNGYQNRFEILSRHLNKVCQIAKEEGLKPNIWSDMFFRLSGGGKYSVDHPHLDLDKIGTLPEGLALTYWDYYPTKRNRYRAMIREHKKLTDNLWFAGGIWTWKGFAPDNRHSMRTCFPGLTEARELGVENAFVTLWGDNGGECSRWAVLPALFAISRFVHGQTSMLKIYDEFKETFGVSFRRFLEVDLVLDKKNVANPEKYLLYQDPFMGILDSTLLGTEALVYKKSAAKLSRLAKEGHFSLLFASQASLARTLSYKADLGVRTRTLYRAKDKEGMRRLIGDYNLAIRNLAAFIKNFRALWFSENRPQGFEVQETRLGGLRERLTSCRDRLQNWIENDVPIPELDEEVLDYHGAGSKLSPGHFRHTQYLNMFTAGRT